MSAEKSIKEVQAKILEVMKYIDELCRKNGITYYIMGGTALGAVRHGGFIPWDDDLDIGMPRDDYEKFMQVAKSELSEKYYLQNTDTESEYWLTFAKIRKNNTVFEEPSVAGMSDKIHKGIFVDIFPFDYVKKNSGVFVHLQFILSKAIIETMYYKAGVYSTKASLNYKTLDSVLNMLSMRMLSKLQSKIASAQNRKKSKYLADLNSSRKYLAAIYPISYFLPVQDGDFAGKKFKIPNDYDTYLKMVYGDYMKLPKEEERVNHRTLRIIFDASKEI